MDRPAWLVRAPSVVWRVVTDRALVRRVPMTADDAARDPDTAELIGPAAMIFVAADRPVTTATLSHQLGIDRAAVAEVCSVLLAASWLVEVEP